MGLVYMPHVDFFFFFFKCYCCALLIANILLSGLVIYLWQCHRSLFQLNSKFRQQAVPTTVKLLKSLIFIYSRISPYLKINHIFLVTNVFSFFFYSHVNFSCIKRILNYFQISEFFEVSNPIR